MQVHPFLMKHLKPAKCLLVLFKLMSQPDQWKYFLKPFKTRHQSSWTGLGDKLRPAKL